MRERGEVVEVTYRYREKQAEGGAQRQDEEDDGWTITVIGTIWHDATSRYVVTILTWPAPPAPKWWEAFKFWAWLRPPLGPPPIEQWTQRLEIQRPQVVTIRTLDQNY